MTYYFADDKMMVSRWQSTNKEAKTAKDMY